LIGPDTADKPVLIGHRNRMLAGHRDRRLLPPADLELTGIPVLRKSWVDSATMQVGLDDFRPDPSPLEFAPGAGIRRASAGHLGRLGDTSAMTAATMKIDRSGPAVRAALEQFAPDEVAAFEAELGQAIADAATSLDLASAQAVLDRWWGIAAIRANPLTAAEKSQVDRARHGDVAGLVTRDERGEWVRL
jgi:hypothetical protein